MKRILLIAMGLAMSLSLSQTINAQTFPDTTSGSTAIPDNGCGSDNSIMDIIPVSGLGGELGAAINLDNVCINITHTFDGDLEISLQSPEGTIIDLSSDNGSSGDNYTNTCFSDEGTSPITGGTAPFTGTFTPEEPISSFDGENPNGDWILIICDDANLDFGTLDSWSLEFGLPPTCPNPGGQVTSNVTFMGATFSWTSTQEASSYLIYFGPEGFDPDTISPASLVDTFANVNGLVANTTYDWYVQAFCDVGDSSEIVGPATFTTACEPVVGDSLPHPIFTGPLPYSDIRSNENCYTNQYTDQSSPDVFYQFTTSADAARIVATTCAAGSDFDTYIHILDDTGTEIAEDDDDPDCAFSNRRSTVILDVTPSTTYYVVVEGFSTNTGTFELSITEQSCVEPTGFILDAVTTTTATVSWNDIATAVNYVVYADTSGFDMTMGTPMYVSDPEVNLTGLMESTSYDVYVRTICGEGDTSEVSNVFTFSTPDFCQVPQNFQVDSVVFNDIVCLHEIFVSWDTIVNIDELWLNIVDAGEPVDSGLNVPLAIESLNHLFQLQPETSKDLRLYILCTNGDTVATSLRNVTTGYMHDFCSKAVDLDTLINLSDTCTLTYIQDFNQNFITFSADQGAPSGSCPDSDASPNDIWFKATVPPSGTISWDFLQHPGVTTIVELYTGTCGALTPYSPVLCSNVDLRTFVGLTPGTVVYFRVWDYGSDDSGTLEFCLTSPNCAEVTAPFIDTIYATSATIGWTAVNSAIEFIIKVGEDGFDPDTATCITTTDTFVVLNNLMGDTDYDIYIQTICESGDTTSGLGPLNFTSPCEDDLGDQFDNPFLIELPFYGVANTGDSCVSDRGGANASNDHWYKFTTGENTDSLVITTCDDTTNFDTYLILVDMDLNIVAFDDDDPSCVFSTLRSTITVGGISPNTMYYVIVEGFDLANGTYGLSIDEFGPVCQSVLNLTGTLSAGTYEASDTINFNGTVPMGTTVFFNAPNININENATIDGEIETTEIGCN